MVLVFLWTMRRPPSRASRCCLIRGMMSDFDMIRFTCDRRVGECIVLEKWIFSVMLGVKLKAYL